MPHTTALQQNVSLLLHVTFVKRYSNHQLSNAQQDCIDPCLCYPHSLRPTTSVTKRQLGWNLSEAQWYQVARNPAQFEDWWFCDLAKQFWQNPTSTITAQTIRKNIEGPGRFWYNQPIRTSTTCDRWTSISSSCVALSFSVYEWCVEQKLEALMEWGEKPY